MIWVAVFAALVVRGQVIKVAGGRAKALLWADGSVASWGKRPVRVTLPEKAIDVAALGETLFAVLADGSVVTWTTGAPR